MGRLVRVLLLVSLVFIVSTGCGPRNYSLPKSWPIPQLTLPVGSTIVMKPIVMHQLNPAWQDKTWYVDFDCPTANLAAVVDHVESCLKPLEYNEFWIVNPQIGSSRVYTGSYFSPDGKTEVSIMKGDKQPGAPAGYPSACEYVLSITITPAPALGLKYAGTTSDIGVKTYLEPIQ